MCQILKTNSPRLSPPQRIGIITSDNVGAIDTGEGIFSDETKKAAAGEVIYKGRFAELANGASDVEIEAAASDRGPIGLATHTRRLKELGVRVIFVSVFSTASMTAMFKAFSTAGFCSTGYAIVATWLYGVPSSIIPPKEAQGMIMLEQVLPPCSAGVFCATNGDVRNAHDAMYALLNGVGKVITGSDGGVDYKANKDDKARLIAMATIRQTKLPAKMMSTGKMSGSGGVWR